MPTLYMDPKLALESLSGANGGQSAERRLLEQLEVGRFGPHRLNFSVQPANRWARLVKHGGSRVRRLISA